MYRKTSMRFCERCNNLLHPRENRPERKLEYFCREDGCGFVLKNLDPVQDCCVFVNELIKDSSTKLEAINSDLKKDPTLQRMRDVNCRECGHNEAVFFLAEQTSKSAALNLVFVCCNPTCKHKWME